MPKTLLNRTTCALTLLLLLGAGGLLGQGTPEFNLAGVTNARILTAPPHDAFLAVLDLGDKVALMVTASLTGPPGRVSVTSDDVYLRYSANGETKEAKCIAMPLATPDFLTAGISDWSKASEYKPAALYVNFALPQPREVRFVFPVPKDFESAWLVQKAPGGGDVATKQVPALSDK